MARLGGQKTVVILVPHVYEDHMWDKIKDEFVHLRPRTPKHLELSLKGMGLN